MFGRCSSFSFPDFFQLVGKFFGKSSRSDDVFEADLQGADPVESTGPEVRGVMSVSHCN